MSDDAPHFGMTKDQAMKAFAVALKGHIKDAGPPASGGHTDGLAMLLTSSIQSTIDIIAQNNDLVSEQVARYVSEALANGRS